MLRFLLLLAASGLAQGFVPSAGSSTFCGRQVQTQIRGRASGVCEWQVGGVGLGLRAAGEAMGAKKLGMIYTPPRQGEDQAAFLDSLRQNLDSQLSSGGKLEGSDSIFKPKVKEEQEDNVMRSPCTSLYGNWRPTTGTESFKSASTVHKAKAAASSFSPAEAPKKETRKRRPVAEKKKAVKPELLPEFVARASFVLTQNGGSMDSNLFGQSWKQTHVSSPLNNFKGVKGVTIHQMLRENGKFFAVSDTDRQKVKFFELKSQAVEEYLNECREAGVFVMDVAANPALAAPPLKLAEDVEEEAQDAVVQEEIINVQEAEQEIIQGVQRDFKDFQIPEEFANLDAEGEELQAQEQPVAAAKGSIEMYSEIPVQGKARHMALDRRILKAKRAMQPAKKREEKPAEDLPAPPQATPDDAAETPVIALYNSWAVDGRDVVMEITHRSAFDEMWASITEKAEERGEPFTVIDAGCGNGWAARMMGEHELVESVTAVDGAALMIEKAENSADDASKVEYVIGDIEAWEPEEPTDVVQMVESLYLLEDPEKAVKHIAGSWMKEGGRFMASLDCYKENKLSHTWEEDMGVTMHCWSEKDWARVLKKAGLKDIELWRAKTSGPWQGPLIVTGVKA